MLESTTCGGRPRRCGYRLGKSTKIQSAVKYVLGIEIKADNPLLVAMLEAETEFMRVCEVGRLDDYADDIAEYVTDARGGMRTDVTSATFAMQFAVSDADADVILAFVRAFFELIEAEKKRSCNENGS